MPSDLSFDTDFAAEPGTLVPVSALVRRMVAPNPGPFTFTGTCCYVVGHGDVAVIDPGPDLPDHLDALAHALAGERVTHVVATHTHRDHSPGATLLARRLGVPLVGCGPHRPSRPLGAGGPDTAGGSGDRSYRPDRELADGDAIEGPGWTLRALATPGHTANHLAFALPEEAALFSGDHVMAWNTTIVAPPDGSMTDFMASLERLRGRDEAVYWPGHGGPVRDPGRMVRALIGHRRQREASIVKRLAAGDRTAAAMVETIYAGLAPALRGAAALSVFAHLENLVARRLAETDGAPRADGEYRLTAS